MQIIEQVSAGGVVFRENGGDFEIALVSIAPSMRWQLPKGLVDKGETNEQAAIREVREEAGIESRMVAPIETIEYWYVADYGKGHARYHKFVHFFLLQYLSGDVADHDTEVAEARWVNIDEAKNRLAFENEQKVVKKAAQMLVTSRM